MFVQRLESERRCESVSESDWALNIRVPASLALDDAFASRLDKIGLPNRSLKLCSVPKNPGIRKSNRLQSSSTLFWIGVPERMSRCCARMFFTDLDSFVLAFLIIWPSSRMQ